MDNLPQTFLIPPLMTIMAEFKPEGDLVHPLREEAKLETLKWFSSYEGLDAKSMAIMKLTRSDYMAALVYPDIDFDDLVLAMKWFYWAFFLDDTVDSGQLSQEGVENLVQMYENVQRNRDIAEHVPLPLIIEIFQGIWLKMRQRNRPCFESLFATGSINYVRGLPGQNKMRHEAEIPDIETHKLSRRQVVFIESVLQFTGFILDLKVDQEILQSSEMKELNATYIELGWLLNDIISWNIEQRKGDICNLISLIMIHEQKSVQDAMDDTEQELRSQVLKSRSAKTRVLQTYRDHKDIEDLKTYIEKNQVWIWAAVEWSMVAGERYFGNQKASEEAQNTGIVHIMPREVDT
ncbi:isoprenoid synthase domain-containing protein [Mycena vulgaris]|nr:isoprenoid synthase domain-containing protein [Mycena vulgaris]